MASKIDLGYIKGPKGDTGATGPKGAQGIQGPKGIGISTATPQYYLSTSSTSLSGGSWSNTIPTWASGRYYWTRTHYVYTNNTSYDSVAVYDSALTDAVSKATTANSNASSAVSKANTASSNASSALSKANTAESNALNAKNNAATALEKVNAMTHQCCTQAEYDRLASNVKNNGTFYFIS